MEFPGSDLFRYRWRPDDRGDASFDGGLKSFEDPQLRIHFLLLLFLAFSFPLFQKGLPLLSMLLGLNALVFSVRHGERMKEAYRENRGRLLPFGMLLFFILHVLGLFWGSDLSSGLYALQQKSVLALFPLIFLFMPRLSSREMSRLLFAFLLGAGIASSIGMISAFYGYWSAGDGGGSYLLYGKHFSILMHRGYFALYLLFAAYIAWEWVLRWDGGKAFRTFLLLLFLFSVLGIFLSGSRAAILILFIMVGVQVLLKVQGSLLKRLGVLGLASLLALGTLFLFPRNIDRFEHLFFGAENEKGVRSTWAENERVIVWELASTLFLEHFWTGMGTGNGDAALKKAYKERGNEEFFARGLNAHCQFLQSGLALGVGAVLVLLGIFALGIARGWSSSGPLLQVSLILFVGALFESLLERQAGVIFFAFILPLLYVVSQGVEEKLLWKGREERSYSSDEEGS